jgi:hypothetical protein
MPPSSFNFSEALRRLQNGERVTRAGWASTPAMSIALQPPSPHSLITVPCICLYVGGETLPWACTQTDILATDWSIAADQVAGLASSTGR